MKYVLIALLIAGMLLGGCAMFDSTPTPPSGPDELPHPDDENPDQVDEIPQPPALPAD